MKQILLIIIEFTLTFCSEREVRNQVEAKPLPKTVEQKKILDKTNLSAENELSTSLDSISNSQNNVPKESEIKLETFKKTPDDIDGCGCALFLTKKDWKKHTYIYADAGNVACIKVNGKLELLELNEYNEKTSTYIYSNPTINLKVEHIKSYPNKEEETTNVEKLITITKGTDKIERKVLGYCGC